MTKGHGLQFDTIQPEDFYLGGGFIGTKEIQPDGQWDGFLPEKEIQNKNGIETMACTIYGTQNCIEILLNKVLFESDNFSERFNAILAGITQSGGSPHNAAECIRKNGMINDEELPFDESIDSWEKYYSPIPMPKKYLTKGLEWLKEYDFKHEWVFTNELLEQKIQLIKEALKRSPVGMSVYSWSSPEDGVYQKQGQDNHWVCCYGYTDKGWKIFDSYDNSQKIYSFNANISMAKLYWISKKNGIKKGWFEILLDFIKNITIKV